MRPDPIRLKTTSARTGMICTRSFHFGKTTSIINFNFPWFREAKRRATEETEMEEDEQLEPERDLGSFSSDFVHKI